MVRAGAHLRVTVQLVEGAAGTLVWSHAAEVPLGDLFRLQDLLVEGIVTSLALPLTGRDRQQLRRDAPASAKGYEHYLRANELAQRPKHWAVARELYLQALDLDPQFAPAWARLARLYRLMAKYESESSAANLTRAEDALRQALRLSPDLSIVHHLSAQIEIDAGRADEALARLIKRARDRPDAQLFAALVHTCRVCGLIEESLAAHHRARQIDPAIETGVMHTYWLLHRYEDALATSDVKAYVAPASLVQLGRIEEARALIAELEVTSGNRVPALARAVRAFIDGRHDEGVEALIAQTKTTAVPDPEMLFYVGRHLAHVGEPGEATAFIRRSVEGGYSCYTAFATDGWLDSVRSQPAFSALLETVRVRSERARDIFVEAGGRALLGTPKA
jgi:tetratricopeptide (TPR) repeat protein